MAENLNLLIVNPSNRAEIYQKLGNNLAAFEPPIWGGLLATYIRQRGYSVDIIDADAESLSLIETVKRILEFSPLLVTIMVFGHQPSASTQNMLAASRLCSALKAEDPKMKVLLLGGHVAALPERTLLEEQADYVCDGEGPITVLDLLDILKNTKLSDLSSVRGLWYRHGGQIQSNSPAPLLENLDQDMPAVAWDLLPMEKYRAHNWHCFGGRKREPYAAIYTTLGCPYHCNFCCIQAPFKTGEKEIGYKESVNSYRFWSPEKVLAQIDVLVSQYGIQNIKIADEMFVLNKSHVSKICDLIIDRQYDLNIWAYARVDTVREGMLENLKRAGINWLALGIESASKHVRDGSLKMLKQDDIVKTVRSIQSAGINVIGNYIFGLPDDTQESMKQTLDLAVELNCEFANFYSAMAYPGSLLYDMALKNGTALPEKWSGYSQHSVDSLPLPTEALTAGEVLAFRDQAFHAYFSDPKYLKMVGEKFGNETENDVRKMSIYRLPRMYAA